MNTRSKIIFWSKKVSNLDSEERLDEDPAGCSRRSSGRLVPVGEGDEDDDDEDDDDDINMIMTGGMMMIMLR